MSNARSGGSKASKEKEAAVDRTAQQFSKDVVLQMSRTQAGSKLLQQKLLKGHPTVINEILEGIAAELPDLMCHMYGNYLCSASFQACSAGQRKRLLELAAREFPRVSMDKWGTHAMQSLISLVCTKEETAVLTPALQDNIVELSCDPNGAHVVQRALTSFGDQVPEAVLREVAKSVCKIAQSSHGLSVLKRCISQCRCGLGQQLLLGEFARHVVELAQGPFGNYALQQALSDWGGERCRPLLEALRGELPSLSCHKFSLNVVERALRVAPPDLQELLMEELALGSQAMCRDVTRRLQQAVPAERQRAFENAIAAAATAGSSTQGQPGFSGSGAGEPRRRNQRGRRSIGGDAGDWRESCAGVTAEGAAPGDLRGAPSRRGGSQPSVGVAPR